MHQNLEENIICYLAGEMSPERKERFENEVSQSELLSSELDAYTKIWQLTNQLDYMQDEAKTSWVSFQKKVKAPFKILGLDWRKIAASITLLAAFSFSMWFFGSTDINLTATDHTQEVTLVDQTTIRLHKNSTVIYDKGSFGKETRIVCLEGQAYFDVAKSEKQFIVRTKHGDIKVFGTEFNVFADDDLLFVELEEGSVAYCTEEFERKIVPGERIEVSQGTLQVNTFDQGSAWDEVISCKNVPLSYILGQLKLNFDVDYKVSKSLLKQRYTINLPKDDLALCIQILHDVSGKNFALIDNIITVK